MCPVCQSPALPYLSATVLQKYPVQYLRCPTCGLIFTEPPYWLDEAYSSAITSLDIGLPQRNIAFAPVAEAIIRRWFNADESFLDFGGGYGLFVRLMRDRGFDFYWQDQHCDNLFAKSFEADKRFSSTGYELVTAFEVLEHVPDPVATLEQLFRFGHSILLSTELQPHPDVTPANWWYFTPETGQHICLHTITSLQILADRFQVQLYTNGRSLHLLTPKPIQKHWFKQLTRPAYAKLYNRLTPGKRKSLLWSDYDTIAQTPFDRP